jgi:hypothetical protein
VAARATDSESVDWERICCIANGYWVTDIKPGGKGELHKGWQETRGLPPYDPLYSSTSIICESLRAFDFDIDDRAVARQALGIAVKHLDIGEAICRTRGTSPRGVFVFRAERLRDGTWPRKRTLKLTGSDNKIEILGHGQQFVAFGPHSSGVPYRWIDGSPLDRRRAELPVATDGMIDALSSALDQAGLLVKDTGRREGMPQRAAPRQERPGIDGRQAGPQGVGGRRGNGMNSHFTMNVGSDRVTVDDAVLTLTMMPNDFPPGHPLRLGYEDWRDLAFACHFILNEEADADGGRDPDKERRLFSAFATFSGNYPEEAGKRPQGVETLWNSTRDPRDITAGTLVHFARERIRDFAT